MTITAACLYTYLALVTSVYDADTITVNVDLGMNTWRHDVKIRLARINAPEVRGPERDQGLKARDWLRGRIDGQQIILRTQRDKKGKFGRWLGEIYLDGENLNDALVNAGHAVYKTY